jgi:hypothetical protein
VTNAQVDDFLNQANTQFNKDILYLTKRVTLNVRDLFTCRTDEGFNLTIGGLMAATDIVPGSAGIHVTGTALATLLQTAIQAASGGTGVTCTWGTSTKKFTITAPSAGTSITITYPSVSTIYDKRYELFGVKTAVTESDNSYTGEIAKYCTSLIRLPTDFIQLDEAVYDGNYSNPLKPEIRKGRSKSTGTPTHISIERADDGRQLLRLTPEPSTIGKMVEINYFYVPAAITTGSGSDATKYEYPDWMEDGLIWYAVYLYKQSKTLITESLNALAMYQRLVDDIVNRGPQEIGGGYDMTERGRQGL